MLAERIDRRELELIRTRLEGCVVRDDHRGIHRVARDVYLDELLFELERRYIFEANWVYFAHESQIANPNDYITAKIGRQPVVVTRGADGAVRGFLNVCSHRGALLYREKRGNAKIQMCGFHGWCFNGRGELVNVKEQETGDYPTTFDRKDHGLKAVRVESYRGFMFASLKPEVGTLEEYLGDAKSLIDMLVDQSSTGDLEVLDGSSRYTIHANWKLSAEGGVDGYHVFPVHVSFIETMQRRVSSASGNKTGGMDLSKISVMASGCMAFENGHVLIWADYPNYTVRPQYAIERELIDRFGEDIANWMVRRVRNLCVYPNLIFHDAISSQVRVTHPISVNSTLVETYCIAPVGESPSARNARIRQYEDFYNVSGTATPDDLAEFNFSQKGFEARGSGWTELSRGMGNYTDGPNDEVRRIGLQPKVSSDDTTSELIYCEMYANWRDRMIQGVDLDLGKT